MCNVLFKLCEENHRVQSKISDVSLSIEFHFETRLQLFVYTFSQFTMTPDLFRKGHHIHISSVIFVISMMLMNVFVCPYYFLNITVIPVCFYYFNFCFIFYYPIVDIIVNHLYLLFFRSRKTNTKCFHKNEKKTSVIIFAQLVRSVPRNGCLCSSTLGPRPLSSTLSPRSHFVAPWPRKYCKSKFMNEAYYLFKIILIQD